MRNTRIFGYVWHFCCLTMQHAPPRDTRLQWKAQAAPKRSYRVFFQIDAGVALPQNKSNTICRDKPTCNVYEDL